MNEKLPQQEQQELKPADSEHLLPEGEVEKLLEAGKEEASHQNEQAEQARENIEETAKNSNETEFVEPLSELNEHGGEDAANSPAYIDNQLKEVVRNRELNNLQRQHKPYRRALSKLVHQPVVSKVSEVGSKTVSRPSGLLGGGIVALAGSLGYYLLAKHIGFTYNYAVFFMLFVVGFAVGLILELIIYSLTKNRRRNN